jgi:hypothetical protein
MPENRAGPPASRNHGVFSRIFHWNSPGHGAAAVWPCRTAIPQVKEACLLLPTMRAGTVWRVAEWVKDDGVWSIIARRCNRQTCWPLDPEVDFFRTAFIPPFNFPAPARLLGRTIGSASALFHSLFDVEELYICSRDYGPGGTKAQ